MDTMKLFGKLLLIFVAFYIFSEIASTYYLKSTYSSLDKIEIAEQTPKIEINESKATKIDGYIKGKIVNTENDVTENKYIKVDCYSKYNNYLGSEYGKLGNIKNGESKEFKIKYKFEEVDNIKVSITDQAPENKEFNFRELTKLEKAAFVIGGLIVIYYLPARYLFGIFPF